MEREKVNNKQKHIEMEEGRLKKVIKEAVRDAIIETISKSQKRERKFVYGDYVFVQSGTWGLPVDVLLDNGGIYELNSYGLLMFFRNGYTDKGKWVPMIVGENPKMLNNTKLDIYRRDYYKIYTFIVKNRKHLKQMADEKLSYLDFYKMQYGLLESRKLITEMTILPPDLTGAPLRIWVDNGMTWKHSKHGPRLKIESPKGSKDSNTYASVKLPSCELVKDQNNIEAPKNDLYLTLKFIQLNSNLLYDTTIRKITIEMLMSGMKCLDKDGNEIPKDKEWSYLPVSKRVYGYVIVKNDNDEYNFVDKDGKLLLDKWMDSVSTFIKKEGKLVSYITKEEKPFVLTITGGIPQIKEIQ